MRISKIAPSAPLAREMVRPIKTGQRPLFRVVPPLMWRTRFAAVHTSLADLSLLASLDIEVASYTSYGVSIRSVNLALLGGDIKRLTSVDTSAPSSPGDQLSYLYKATPDLSADGTPALGTKGHILTLSIEADIHISPSCTPHVAIMWRTSVDFASEARANLLKAAHRLSTASYSDSTKSAPALPAPDPDPAANAINLTLTITGPPRVKLGEPFHWSVFIVNRSDKPRRLAITVLPKRKRDAHTRPSSSSSTSIRPASHAQSEKPLLAPAVADENAVYARQKGARAEPAELVCLTTDMRLGTLAPGSCYTADVRFVALGAGEQAVECVRLVDVATGETADIRDLPSIVVGGGE
jgi:hypothetical protein